MAASQIFNVLTEFRFDIAHAVAGSKTMQSEVGKISAAADQAHFALQKVGASLVAQTGLGVGGIAGAIYAAVKAADKFESSQRAIANIMLSNQMFTGADAYSAAMQDAAFAMENMRKTANEFSLPADELANFSKLIGATLVSHGLDNSRLEQSTRLSRGFLKSAPVLGIDPGLASGQLLDSVMGRANMGDTLFQRLTNETAAMKGFGGTAGAKAFNALEPAKRVKVLDQALMQFGSNAKVVSENALSLSAQMQRLKDNFVGTFSILKPIGKAIMDPLKKIVFQINTFLEKDGRKIAQTFGKLFTDILKDPEKLFVSIQQFRRLSGDVSKAGSALGFIALLHGLTAALRFFGFTLKGGLIATGLRMLGSGIASMGSFLVSSGALLMIFRAMSFVVTKVLAPLALFTLYFQAFSRAIGKVEVALAKFFAGRASQISEIFVKLTNALRMIMLPLELAVEGLSEFFAFLLSSEMVYGFIIDLLDSFAEKLQYLGYVMVGMLSVVSGVIGALLEIVQSVRTLNFKDFWARLGTEFNIGFDEFFKKYSGIDAVDVNNQATAMTKIQIDKIEIKNDFKENAEPDRIAFTLKEQLLKAALNPTQSSGRFTQGALVGN